MSDLDTLHCNCKGVLADQQAWKIILSPAFDSNPGAADALAHLLFILKNSIASGGNESAKVITTLEDGIRMVWPYTREHHLAYELYEVYLLGDLKPADEPLALLNGALLRFKKQEKKNTAAN